MAEKVYIERDELESRIKKYVKCRDADRETLEWAKDECIRQAHCMPAADVVPVVHGRWITDENTEGYTGDTQCTACKGFLGEYDPYICKPGENSFFYCPNCGAKMDGAADNNVGDKGR